MSQIDWEPLRRIIDNSQRFVLASHVRPDADAIGSELALAGLLEARGKSVRIVNPSAVPDNLLFLDPEKRVHKVGEGLTVEAIADCDAFIVVDTSAWVQLVDVGRALRMTKAKKAVIDHHASADDIGAEIFKDITAEATGALIFRMAEALGYPVTPNIAKPLFCAIATDTGWFRFSSTTSDTLRIASRLIDLGVQPNLIYEQLYEQCSAARIKLAGRVLDRVTLDCNNLLAYTWVKLKDFEETGAKPVDTEELVNECLKIAGTHAAFIAIEQPNKRIKFSLRSRTMLNVAKIAEEFGGGGHKQAAGAILPGPLKTAMNKILAAFTASISLC